MRNICLLLFFGCFGTSCTKMDHTYKPYLSGGEIIYTGGPANLEAHSGRERVELQFTRSKDPNIVKYSIYWNNKMSKIEVAADKSSNIQKVIVPNLAEGDYTFEVVAYDKAGNASTPGSAIVSGKALGSAYENNLVVRGITFANSKAGLIATIPSVDTTCKYTLVTYQDEVNNTKAVSYTKLQDFQDTLKDVLKTASSVIVKTAYMPLKGIDTFYAVQNVALNLVAAQYVCTGSMTDYTSAALTGPYPWNVTMVAVTPTQVELFDNDQTKGIYHKILNNGSGSSYGEFGVVINLDANNNVISVVNKYGQPSSNGRSAELDPSGVNKFDPVTKILKVKYWMNQPGATHRTTFDETFTMK